MILILSDIHLGTPVSKYKEVIKLIKKEKPDKIILAGDIVDINCTSRLKRKEWEFFAYLRKLSKNKEIIYLSGNHDRQIAPFISELLGFQHFNEYLLNWKNKKIWINHLDIFDLIIGKHPKIVDFF